VEVHPGVGLVMTTRVGLSILFGPEKCQRGLCVDGGSIGGDTGQEVFASGGARMPKTSAAAYDPPVPTSLGIYSKTMWLTIAPAQRVLA
jgi:hypothetical protein